MGSLGFEHDINTYHHGNAYSSSGSSGGGRVSGSPSNGTVMGASADAGGDEGGGDMSSPVCYMCYEGSNAADDPLVSPCDCRGDTRWLHVACLQRWYTATNNNHHAQVAPCIELRISI